MLKAGFHPASLKSYTGFKSSPYTEGAMFYGEKPVNPRVRPDLEAQAELLVEPTKVEGAPGSS